MVIKIQKPPILLQIFTDYYTVSETSVFGTARRRHVERSVTRRLGFNGGFSASRSLKTIHKGLHGSVAT